MNFGQRRCKRRPSRFGGVSVRRYVGIAAVVGVAAACDAFSPPNPSDDFTGDFGDGTETFCPTVAFPIRNSTTALTEPLFAWVTPAERDAIENGGPILPALPATPSSSEQLAANMHSVLSGLPGAQPLLGQPRVGRNFWSFAFSAPRASEDHNQLLAVWLRPDAWFATYGSAYSTVNAESHGISEGNVSLSPGRVAGVHTASFPTCERDGAPELGLVVFREEAIERVRFGAEADAPLGADLVLLQELLNQVRSDSAQSPENAFVYVECGSTYSDFICSESTYFQAIAWRSPEYVPTVPALSRLIDTLKATRGSPDFAEDRTSAEDLNAWTAIWPGPWRTGTGGTGGGGLGGAGGAGGMGGSEQ